MQVQTFKNVWDAIEDDIGKRACLKARSELMMAIEDAVEGWSITVPRAAKRLGTTQARVKALLRGKFNDFTLDELVILAGRAGLNPRIKIKTD
jgi:predicted XRE-type DNA-binding protein